MFKHGESFSVHTCKTKSTRNPLYRWIIGEGPINQFCFSPCSKYLAVVSQDGYLRVFNYDSMELIGTMRSYFGGLLCCCWSPDGKYIVTGGEDDMVTVWCFGEKRVVCRGTGHKSWVNQVSFDPFTTYLSDWDATMDFSGSDDDFRSNPTVSATGHGLLEETLRASTRSTTSRGSKSSNDSRINQMVTYRFGSVGQDTLLCLWDITEDILRQPLGRQRTSTVISNPTVLKQIANSVHTANAMLADVGATLPTTKTQQTTISTSLTHKFATLALGERSHKDKEHKRNFSLGSKGGSGDNVKTAQTVDDSIRLLGSASCPRLPDVAMLEPMVCKKIAHERLTSLVFKEDCIVTACQEGYVHTWARPGKVVSLSF